MEKRILLLCKDRNARIMAILGDQDPAEVKEFQTTIQMVQVVVNRLLVSGGKKQILIDVPLLDQIYTILGQYEELLEQYIASGRLRRLLTSNRMRRKLEKINSDLHVRLKGFVEALKEMNAKQQQVASAAASSDTWDREPFTSASSSSSFSSNESNCKEKGVKSSKDQKANKKDRKKEKKAKKEKSQKIEKVREAQEAEVTAQEQQSPDGLTASRRRYTSIVEVAGNQLAQEHEHLRHLSNEISDPEGKDFWIKLFGNEAFYVEWDEFISELSSALDAKISEDDKALMKHVLDNSGTGHVNMYKWSEFLQGFGPLASVVNNVRAILTAPWFHGFLTSREAELLLEDQPNGTYLIRFSRSSGGSFALAFAHRRQENRVLHILIQSCMPQGFKIDEEEEEKSKYFSSLQEIIDHYSVFLQHPFISELPRETWFHGDVSPPEAIDLLQGNPEGTFLIRFSSQPGCFAASYVSTGEVKHALIQGLPKGGFMFAGEQEVFPNLATLIQAYATTLQHVLPNDETEVAPILRKYLESKKAMKESDDLRPIPQHYSSVDTDTLRRALGVKK